MDSETCRLFIKSVSSQVFPKNKWLTEHPCKRRKFMVKYKKMLVLHFRKCALKCQRKEMNPFQKLPSKVGGEGDGKANDGKQR